MNKRKISENQYYYLKNLKYFLYGTKIKSTARNLLRKEASMYIGQLRGNLTKIINMLKQGEFKDYPEVDQKKYFMIMVRYNLYYWLKDYKHTINNSKFDSDCDKWYRGIESQKDLKKLIENLEDIKKLNEFKW